MTAAGQTTPHGFAQTFIASPPPGWQTGSFISGWAMKWANEVLPIAAQAHGKLTFHTTTHAWGAHCDDLPAYDIWAREQVSLEPEKGLAVRAGLRPTGRSHHRYSWT